MKVFLSVITTILGLLTCLFVGILWERLGFTYNESDRYFDGEMVYHAQAKEFYALLSLFFGAMTLIVGGVCLRKYKII